MATAWRRAMTYLGLGPDEEYDDYDEVEPLRDHAQERTSRQGPPAGPRQGPPMRQREPEYEPSDVAYVGGVRRLQPQPVDPSPGIGAMEKVAHQVYLLTPSNVEVSPEERRRLQERGLYD